MEGTGEPTAFVSVRAKDSNGNVIKGSADDQAERYLHDFRRRTQGRG